MVVVVDGEEGDGNPPPPLPHSSLCAAEEKEKQVEAASCRAFSAMQKLKEGRRGGERGQSGVQVEGKRS